jgi:hypothetical protein
VTRHNSRRHSADWKLQGYMGILGRDEIVLGLPFLQSIQITNLNWKNEEIEFREIQDNSYHRWTRKTEKRKQKPNMWQISTKEEMVEIAATADVFEITIQPITKEKKVAGNPTGAEKVNTLKQQLETAGGSDKQLTTLLIKYMDRFKQPTGVPVKRQEDMEINLIPGSKMPTWAGSRKLNEQELESLTPQVGRRLG